MLTPLLRAIGQLDDPAILGVLLRAGLVAALCFAGLAAGSAAFVHHLASGHGWLSTLAEALGGLLGLATALWFFLPVAVVIAGFFQGTILTAVERRWYPELPPPHGADWAGQLREAVVTGLQLAALSVVSLLIALIPGPGTLVAMALTAWALGRGLFGGVALRRMSREDALALYRRRRWRVLAQGAALTVAGAVPVLNLLIPVIGPAAMLHVVMEDFRNNKYPA